MADARTRQLTADLNNLFQRALRHAEEGTAEGLARAKKAVDAAGDLLSGTQELLQQEARGGSMPRLLRQ